MPASHRNPDVPNTAARYVAKAMTRVHPRQREELLWEIVSACAASLGVIQGQPADPDILERSFLSQAREELGGDLGRRVA